MAEEREYALKFTTQSDQARTELEKMKEMFDLLSKAAEETLKTEEHGTQIRKQATKSVDDYGKASKEAVEKEKQTSEETKKNSDAFKDMAFQAGLGSIAAQNMGMAFQEVSNSIGMASEQAGKVAASVSRAGQAFITMGPIAGLMAVGMEAVKFGIEAVIDMLNELNRQKINKDLIEGTYDATEGFKKLDEQIQQNIDTINKLNGEVETLTEQNARLEAGTFSLSDSWRRQWAIGSQLQALIKGTTIDEQMLTKAQKELNEETGNASGALGGYLKQVEDLTVAEMDNAAAAIELIEKKKELKLITDAQAEAMYKEILNTKQATMTYQDYIKVSNEATKSAQDLAAKYEELWKTHEEGEKKATSTSTKAFDERKAAMETLTGRIKELTTSSYDYQIYLLEKEKEEFKRIKVDELEIEKWFALELEQINEEKNENLLKQMQAFGDKQGTELTKLGQDKEAKANAEREKELAAQQKQALDIVNIAQNMSNQIIQIEQAANDWKVQMQEQFGQKVIGLGEMRKKVEHATALEVAKDNLKQLAWEFAKRAAANLVAGNFVKAGLNSAAAVFLGGAAAAAGGMAKSARGEVEEWEERQQRSLQERQERERQQEERRNEYDKTKGGGGTSGRGGGGGGYAGTYTGPINIDARLTVNGNILGMDDFKRELEKLIYEAMRRSRV